MTTFSKDHLEGWTAASALAASHTGSLAASAAERSDAPADARDSEPVASVGAGLAEMRDSDGRSTEPVLRVREVRKRFMLHLRDGRALPVLHGVSLDVHAGECVALVGASGQGKSTLIKALYGSYGVDSGQIAVRRADGSVLDMAQASPQEVLALRRRDLAYVSQFLRAVPRVSAWEVVAERLLQADDRLAVGGAEVMQVATAIRPGVAPRGAAAELHPAEASRSATPAETSVTAGLETTDRETTDLDSLWQAALQEARARVAALFERLNLPPALWELPPATFSGGEQQRVNIARGFILPSRLLLLDEPTASLDAANRQVVVQLIQEAKAAGAAVVGIFHDEEVRDAVATRQVSLPRAG